MKIKVKREKLQKGLHKVSNIIGSRSTLPILANVLIEADNGTVVLTTTDLELRIKTQIEAEVERPGTTTIPVKKFLSMVEKFDGDTVALDCNENHHTRVVCGTSDFRLLGLPSADFPLPVEFSSVRRLKLKEAEFARILDQISYAVSLEDSRKVLHGILVSIKENTFTSVATDGKRLALVEKIIQEFSGSEGDIILPLRTATEIKRLMEKDGEVDIEIGEKQALFKTKNFELTTKLIEGNYPNFRQVIPNSFSKQVEVPRARFLSKLELVSIALPADEKAFIRLTFESGKVKFEAASNNIGEGLDFIEIDYQETPVNISFNPTFLADPFKHTDADKINFKLNDGYSPIAIEDGEGFLYVIMPMRGSKND